MDPTSTAIAASPCFAISISAFERGAIFASTRNPGAIDVSGVFSESFEVTGAISDVCGVASASSIALFFLDFDNK